jgi:hypothetical protein
MPEHFAAWVERHEAEAARCAATPSKRGLKWALIGAERDRAAIEPARAFWAEVDRITKASGIEPAKARENAAREVLREAVDRIMVTDDWTIAGAVIKAQALAA